ncbi:hypothetical protein [Streptomyces sp. SID8385]|uniref:hypothetical protein n=1 Tax=Streptomyces sp. SID8385 TaxID=2690364 RepID=UPI00136188D2|nr:hypothetical protein [Streptomyces sp. SID8385]
MTHLAEAGIDRVEILAHALEASPDAFGRVLEIWIADELGQRDDDLKEGDGDFGEGDDRLDGLVDLREPVVDVRSGGVPGGVDPLLCLGPQGGVCDRGGVLLDRFLQLLEPGEFLAQAGEVLSVVLVQVV